MVKKVDIGKIYLIKCDITGFCYIGMTYYELVKRFNEHLVDKESIVYNCMKTPVIKLIDGVKGTEKLVRKLEKNYTIEYKKLYGHDCINRTNSKEDEIKISGWNYVEKVGNTIITECDGYFMIKYKNLDKWMNKKVCFKEIGRDEGMLKVYKFIENLV